MHKQGEPNAGTRTRLRRALEGYARRHPHASDTLDGIAQWWLPDVETSRSELERALDELVVASVFRSTALPGGRRLYSVRRRDRR